MKMKKVMALCMAVAMGVPAFATTWYVSPAGAKKNEGTTPDAPLKTIYGALEKAAPGDKILVAAGVYGGAAGVGHIEITKAVELYGGYSADFKTRDFKKNQSIIRPKMEQNATPPKNGTVEFTLTDDKGTTVFDGFFIDHSDVNAYHPREGKPEGFETGYWLEPPTKGDYPFASLKKYAIYGNTTGTFTITNCLILNSSFYAININHLRGVVNIKNNLLINSRMMACNVSCRSAKAFDTRLNFEYNTVLFTWSRTKDFGDMGYGVRALSKVDANISHNIIGLSIMSGFDNSMNNRPGEQKVTLDENMFFLNKKGDVSYTVSPSVKYLKVEDEAFEDFEDVKGIESCEKNVSLSDPKVFKGVIDQKYLEAFLSASYTETTDYNPNSAANQFRSAMGMNQVGSIQSKVSMYANKYPYSDNLMKLFGAVKGYGAQ
jgi:hypothetical protein